MNDEKLIFMTALSFLLQSTQNFYSNHERKIKFKCYLSLLFQFGQITIINIVSITYAGTLPKRRHYEVNLLVHLVWTLG